MIYSDFQTRHAIVFHTSRSKLSDQSLSDKITNPTLWKWIRTSTLLGSYISNEAGQLDKLWATESRERWGELVRDGGS